MQYAKRLARGCEATENARKVRGHAPRKEIVVENAKYVISCRFLLIFSTYNSSKVNDILNNNILNFHVWIYNKFLLGFTETFKILSLL